MKSCLIGLAVLALPFAAPASAQPRAGDHSYQSPSGYEPRQSYDERVVVVQPWGAAPAYQAQRYDGPAYRPDYYRDFWPAPQYGYTYGSAHGRGYGYSSAYAPPPPQYGAGRGTGYPAR